VAQVLPKLRRRQAASQAREAQSGTRDEDSGLEVRPPWLAIDDIETPAGAWPVGGDSAPSEQIREDEAAEALAPEDRNRRRK
jgi:hypothetical protein